MARQSPAVADSRLAAVRSLLDAGLFVQAEAQAEGLVADVQADQNAPSTDVLHRATNLLVEALVRNGKGTDPHTRSLAERATETNPLSGRNDSALATSFRNLGDVFVELAEYPSAIEACRRALATRERLTAPDSLDIADDLDHLARALSLAEQYDEALMATERALDIKSKTLEPGHVSNARTLETLGFVLQRKGDYSRAHSTLEQAVALRERANPEHPDLAGALALFGEQLWLEGNLIQANDALARAVAIGEKTLRSGHPNIASYLGSRAIPVADLGDTTAARALRERALALAEKALGSEHPWVALQLNDLAMSMGEQGDYAPARRLLERSLSIYEKRLGPNDFQVTSAIYNLAMVNALLGDFIEARRYFNRAIENWERSLGANHPVVAYALSALAAILSDQGRYVEARVLFQRALTIRENALGRNHRDVARTLSSLSNTVAKLGDVTRAYELSTRALSIWDQSDARDSKEAADALIIHGTLQASLRDYEGSQVSYERALTILRRILGPAHPDVATAQVALAGSLARTGQLSASLQNALEGEAVGRSHLRLTLRYLPERQALGYLSKRPKGLDMALSVSVGDQLAEGAVFDRVVRARAMILDEMAGRHRGGSEAVGSDAAALWKSLTGARQRLANLVVKGPNERMPDQYLSLVEKARQEKEAAERELAESSAAFRAEELQSDVGVDDVRAAIPAGDVLLSFVRFDRTPVGETTQARSGAKTAAPDAYPPRARASYAAFLLRHGESTAKVVRLGDAEPIDQLVAQWRTELIAGLTRSPDSTRTAERSLRLIGVKLRQRIWDPIAPLVANVNAILVVPDGALNLFPLGALPAAGNEYLLENGPVIHYLSAERDLVAGDSPLRVGQGLLALGGASFDDGTTFSATRAQPPHRPVSTRLAASTSVRGIDPECDVLQSLQFEALPASAREANDVSALWTQAGSTTAESSKAIVLTGPNADERSLKEKGPGRRVLHLATHGFFLSNRCLSRPRGTRAVGGLVAPKKAQSQPRDVRASQAEKQLENPLLLSGLALAGANRRAAAGPDDDDGILTAEEVSSMNLQGTEWAVLSACDTGLGEIEAGEGVFGLRRAFQVAGVRTVIMSLWSVEDRSTVEWMRALYDGRLRRGLNTADAVREASLTVLRVRRARGQSTHPFFWAGFVASGDWR